MKQRPLPIGGLIGLAFGGLWSLLGADGLPQILRAPAVAIGVLVSVTLMVRLWWRGAPTGARAGMFRRPGYLVALTAEIAAIAVASTLLPQHGLKGYVLPVVGVIVGLHFIGLWQATRLSSFLWIAAGMCAFSALSAALPEAWNGLGTRFLAAGFGNAAVLWVGAGRTAGRETLAPLRR